jgi:hypothetical protein
MHVISRREIGSGVCGRIARHHERAIAREFPSELNPGGARHNSPWWTRKGGRRVGSSGRRTYRPKQWHQQCLDDRPGAYVALSGVVGSIR